MKPPLFAAIACVLVSLASPAHAQLATPNETGLRYGHVHLNVSNIEVHKKLWAEHFGGVLVQKGPLIAVRLPGMLVALSDQAPTGGSRGTVMDHFGFKVRHLATFLAKWRACRPARTFRVHRSRGVAERVCRGARRHLGRAAGGPGAAGRGRRLPYPLSHARI